MALLKLKALRSNRTKSITIILLAFTLTPAFANDLGTSFESSVSDEKAIESHAIQEVFSGAALQFAPEIIVVSSKSDELDEASDNAGEVDHDEVLFNGGGVEVELSSPESLGPVITELKTPKKSEEAKTDHAGFLFKHSEPWFPAVAPILEAPPASIFAPLSSPFLSEKQRKKVFPAEMLAVDKHPKMPRIAILIDDLGYNRQGMESSLLLPKEVALAILPGTPFSTKTALSAQQQGRVTLLHAPMENQRELKLGPGGLYVKMTKLELQSTLSKGIDGLPGIQGVNNHMGSLLTTKQQSMDWVMETLSNRSLFFIDSLTSPKSVARKTAESHGLKTVSRDVFLDNIRTEKAIDRQFERLIKLARRHGSALAIGHPYAETTSYLKKRLKQLGNDGVQLVPLPDVLLLPEASKH